MRATFNVSAIVLTLTLLTLAALHGCGASSQHVSGTGESVTYDASASTPSAARAEGSAGVPAPGIMDFPTDWPAKTYRSGAAAPSEPGFVDPRLPGTRPSTPSTPSSPLADHPNPVVAPTNDSPAAFTLQPGQELWIIERPPTEGWRRSRPDNDDFPGSATLMTRWRHDGESEEREVAVPLAHTDVHASIAGHISSVTVTQQYHNPYSGKIEAVYVFPLPDDAAVNDFVMTVGSRSIRGVIREREDAQRVYEAAKSRGYHASLMTQERSNIFTQKVANIEPNERVDVTTTYFHTLAFREGGYEFVFPMVIGPRFNPPSCTTGIGAAAAGTLGTGQPTQVQYLRPHERSGRNVSISMDIAASMAIESLESPSHSVVVNADPTDKSRATVQLSSSDSIPNRDFVLRYRLSGGQLKGGFVTHRDERGGFFSFVLVPPSDLRYTQRGPIELVFVVDCSGSMEGEPLRLAKRSVANALGQLRPEDSFQIIRFSDTADFMTRSPIAASRTNIESGLDHVARLSTGGGTMMLKGLEPALELRGDWDRTRFVCVLSDGLLGNEPEVLGQLRRKLGDSRIFTIAIGSAPNRALMNAMSRIGRGAAAYVASDRDADEMMNLFIDRVASAAMTDLRVDWGDLDVTDIYPRRLPDLYVGRPVVITGKFRNPTTRANHEVRVTGRVGRDRQTMTFNMPAAGAASQAPALPLVWARTRITELDEDARWGASPGAGGVSGANKQDITDVALRFGLASAYTSFVAVDASSRTSGSFGTTVAVPQQIPEGMRYDTTVSDR